MMLLREWWKKNARSAGQYPCKNITVLIPNTTIENVENGIDALTNAQGWLNREITNSTAGGKTFSYMTTAPIELSLYGRQQVVFSLQQQGKDCQISIDSIYLTVSRFGLPVDRFNSNDRNIKNCMDYLNKAFNDSLTIEQENVPHNHPYPVILVYVLGIIIAIILIYLFKFKQ